MIDVKQDILLTLSESEQEEEYHKLLCKIEEASIRKHHQFMVNCQMESAKRRRLSRAGECKDVR